MVFKKELLFTKEEFSYNSSLNGTSIKGTYNTMQFTLRLREDIKKALEKRDIYEELIQATSTNLHENMHWWQHIGSNFGFLFSLAYPAFSHLTEKNFKEIISKNILFKPIKKFDQEYYKKHGISDIPEINNILNNYYDLEYAKAFALDNNIIEKIYEDKRYFLNLGHCYHIFWRTTIDTLAGTIDKDYDFLPNIENWVPKFEELKKNQVVGFYVESPIFSSTLGIKTIYEGQAIFNQIQFITSSLGNDILLKDFEDYGFLHGIYLEAFELFLKITQLKKPSDPLDPIVGLFLIICDLAINPNNGFPLDIYDYENFITKNDPGCRFVLISKFVSTKSDFYVEKIKSYSKEEYIILSKELSEGIGCQCSYQSIFSFLQWSKSNEVSKVLYEESKFKFSQENLSIRLLFSKYYRFQEDKIIQPHFFCWFGYHSATKIDSAEFEIIDKLFKKHHALFIEDYDGEIKPTLYEGLDEEDIKETFNSFYNFNIFYDLMMKWVEEDGRFNLDYKWLGGNRAESFIPFLHEGFVKRFNISMDDIVIL